MKALSFKIRPLCLLRIIRLAEMLIPHTYHIHDMSDLHLTFNVVWSMFTCRDMPREGSERYDLNQTVSS